MLNPDLLHLLEDLIPDGDWAVLNEDRPATVCVSDNTPVTPLSGNAGRAQSRVTVAGWGEVYKGRCPVCERPNSRKKRLFVSHISGQFVSAGDIQARTGLVYVCHNEHCRVPELDKNALLIARLPELGINATPSLSSVPYQVLSESCTLPRAYKRVNDPETPDNIREYLIGRGFDLEELATDYLVGWARKDEVWFKASPAQKANGIEDSVTYSDRVVIPIICQGMLAGFQARSIDDDPKYKYLNKPNGLSKSSLLYNLDRAILRKEVCVCEGVTDVWKVGDRGVATFGRNPSEWQLWALSVGWKSDGMGILIPDANDPLAADVARESQRYLVEKEAFPRGCHILELAEGTDPGAYPAETLRTYIEETIAYYDSQQ